MSEAGRGLVLTYHGIERGPAPLFITPRQFARQLEVLSELDASVMTVSALAAALRAGQLPRRAVALTFDDAFASVAEHAAPLLARYGWPATVYCVSGHIGGFNDWPSQPSSVPRRALASEAQLRHLAAAGWEIGAHTRSHLPLGQVVQPQLTDEVVRVRGELEEALDCVVTSFACPYGDPPSPAGRALIEQTYAACCATRPAHVVSAAEVYALPRVDVHYLRRTAMLRRAVRGSTGHLALRRAAARVRRAVVSDFQMSPDTPRAGTGPALGERSAVAGDHGSRKMNSP